MDIINSPEVIAFVPLTVALTEAVKGLGVTDRYAALALRHSSRLLCVPHRAERHPRRYHYRPHCIGLVFRYSRPRGQPIIAATALGNAARKALRSRGARLAVRPFVYSRKRRDRRVGYSGQVAAGRVPFDPSVDGGITPQVSPRTKHPRWHLLPASDGSLLL